MLIYNGNKEFVGITEDTLRSVGYNNATELLEDSVDFADLFENRPGYLHNFKNFSWLEYIIHNDQDNPKARIRCNGKVYESSFEIDNYAFITSDGSEPGFSVELTDLVLIGDDDGTQERELFEPEAPQALQMPDLMQNKTISKPEIPEIKESIPEPIPVSETVEPLPMPDLMEDIEITEEENLAVSPLDIDLMSETPIDDLPDNDLDIPMVHEEIEHTEIKTAQTPQIDIEGLELKIAPEYVYDPSIAADELGLPSDLIDEFVGDFIIQAKKFRPDIEEAISSQDFDNIQILSHKLKGVAANLRIENALEVLTVINSEKDINKLEKYLSYLYQIIEQLEGKSDQSIPEIQKDIEPMSEIIETLKSDNDDDLYTLDPISQSQGEHEDVIPLNMPPFDDALMEIEEKSYDPVEVVSEKSDTTTPLDHIDTSKFDIHKAAENLDIPMETLKSYVDDFVDQANSLKSALESALTSKNFEEVKQLSTQLKGISEALNMTYASDLLSLLQTTEDINIAIDNAKKLYVFIREL